MYTVCINKCGVGDHFLTHVASVPLSGPLLGEEFCNMSLPGTLSRASTIGLLEDGQKSWDPLLVMRVFELINAFRLGTLG